MAKKHASWHKALTERGFSLKSVSGSKAQTSKGKGETGNYVKGKLSVSVYTNPVSWAFFGSGKTIKGNTLGELKKALDGSDPSNEKET